MTEGGEQRETRGADPRRGRLENRWDARNVPIAQWIESVSNQRGKTTRHSPVLTQAVVPFDDRGISIKPSGNGVFTVAGRVLVDERRTRGCVAHPCHQLLGARSRGRRSAEKHSRTASTTSSRTPSGSGAAGTTSIALILAAALAQSLTADPLNDGAHPMHSTRYVLDLGTLPRSGRGEPALPSWPSGFDSRHLLSHAAWWEFVPIPAKWPRRGGPFLQR